MKFSTDRYKFYHYTGKDGEDTIAAVSTYAGKTVKAYAKCDPRDSFDEKSGKILAAARCNAKVAEKREARARRKVIDAQRQLDAARHYYENMARYLDDAQREASQAKIEVSQLEKKL